MITPFFLNFEGRSAMDISLDNMNYPLFQFLV